jgi:AsmA-like C-terminal region
MKSKILKITGITLLVLTAFVGAAPWLFKGKITSLVKARADRDLRAHVSFSGVDISLFRNFPKITIGLDNLQVTCVGEFQDDTLITARQFDLTCTVGSLISGDSIKVSSITLNEPRFHVVVHLNGHANWNIMKSDEYPGDHVDSSARAVNWGIKRYTVHSGYIEYLNESKNIHLEVFNLEQEGRGNFSSELFTLKTKTTADAVNFDYSGAIPCRLSAKAQIDLALHVDSKTHTWSFNTDQVSFNDLKLHTEGFFQWINDSSYNMNIKFKAPSTQFKNILSMLPALYQKDFASIESNGQVNFNGFIRGKYDEKHVPSYHTNLYVQNGYFKYPDLPVPVEHIQLGLQIDNPDGITDHTTINISEGHVEIDKDTVDLHVFLKNTKTKPFIDFAFIGKLDLANMSKAIKLDPGGRLSGLLDAKMYAKGNIPGPEKRKKDNFQSSGNLTLTNFSYASIAYPRGIALDELVVDFNPKNVLIRSLKGAYHATLIEATGSLNDLYDFALGNKPLSASLDVKTEEFNLREWVRSDLDTIISGAALVNKPFIVPDHIIFTINAEAAKFHFDNLDLQNVSGRLEIADQTVHFHQVKANGLDGDIMVEGSYSTLESSENPEIALTYDVKGLDIQKTFFAFNSIRKIMPVAKFMAGNIDAHMSLNGILHNDMTTDPASLQGEGNVHLLTGSLKDFSPMDKLSHSLDIAVLKDMPLKDVSADFSFKGGKVVVSPFTTHSNDIDMAIAGTHGFDQSLDYNINFKIPRQQLGKKGTLFVKNVVTQAADKGIPVNLNDAVSMNVKMSGMINAPDVKEDMDAVVDNAAADLKKEVNAFVNAKLDSAKRQLHNPSATSKKKLMVQTSYKSKSTTKGKKTITHKSKTHSNTKKKHKKATRNYAKA